MLYYTIVAWLPALLGSAPLLVKRRNTAAIVMFVIAGLFLQFLAWSVQPSTAWPLWGFAGFMTIILWVIAAMIDAGYEDGPTALALVPIAAILVLIGSFVSGWNMFRASDYARMIGPMEPHEWTQDIQPKDPRHMAMVTPENALYLAQKAIGQEGAVGSQFHVSSDASTLQRVHNELVYVLPLDFAGFSTWTSSTGVPAYIIVYAEDPERKPLMVKLEAGKEMLYTPAAYWNHDLERHLRQQGYIDVVFSNPRFELDESGKPWWITTTYKPTIAWSGEKVTGVLVTNPSDGTTTEYAVDKAPEWIDRVIPRDIVRSYVDWWGELSGGWLNSFWAKSNLTQPEATTLIYGSDNRAAWVTDVTSKSAKDDSLVGLIYTDTRTGKSNFYSVGGGGTEKAILAAVNRNQDVQYKHLHGDYVQIYNISGTMGAVVPLLNGNNAYQGVAIAELMNPQDVAVGATQFEALNRYKSFLARRGQQVGVENAAEARTLRGVIGRINQSVSGSGGGLYYFIITGIPHIFTASSQDYPKLPLAEKGDTVEVKYLASGESVFPVTGFDDLSIALEHSKNEIQIEKAAEVRKQKEDDHSLSAEATAKFRELTPEQQRTFLKSLKASK